MSLVINRTLRNNITHFMIFLQLIYNTNVIKLGCNSWVSPKKLRPCCYRVQLSDFKAFVECSHPADNFITLYMSHQKPKKPCNRSARYRNLPEKDVRGVLPPFFSGAHQVFA